MTCINQSTYERIAFLNDVIIKKVEHFITPLYIICIVQFVVELVEFGENEYQNFVALVSKSRGTN